MILISLITSELEFEHNGEDIDDKILPIRCILARFFPLLDLPATV